MRKSPFVSPGETLPGTGPPAVEPTARWIRVKLGGEVVADSRRALLLRQYGRAGMPSYYFPQPDVRMDLLGESEGGDEVEWRSVRGVKDAAWIAVHPPAPLAALTGYVSFAWGKMDGWFEEEEEVFVHARDTRQRVDVMPSSRHVRIVVGGETVAETRRPHLLFETNLPTRTYIPREDVRMERLEPTSLKTRCPYKGIASYWNVKAGGKVLANLVWSYPEPIPECPKIRGLMCFYDEKVDVYMDGKLQERPRTPWS